MHGDQAMGAAMGSAIAQAAPMSVPSDTPRVHRSLDDQEKIVAGLEATVEALSFRLECVVCHRPEVAPPSYEDDVPGSTVRNRIEASNLAIARVQDRLSYLLHALEV